MTKYISLFFVIILFLISSCDDNVQYFKIHVNKITSSDTVSIGDTIKFKLDGFVGNNGCYSFSHFDELRIGLNSSISVWGKYTPAGACTLALVSLNEKEYKVIPYQKGIFYLSILQPDYTILNDSVVVRKRCIEFYL